MSSREGFEAVADFMYGLPFEFYDNVGNVFNYSCIVLGFVGLFIWLNKQRKFNEEAKNNTNQLK
jgi:tellurite resistance protein TehA-like permease